MKQVIKYETYDGKLFNTKTSACSHIDKIVTDKLSTLASQLVSIHKYQAIKEFLLENLPKFKEINSILEDCHIDNPLSEDDLEER